MAVPEVTFLLCFLDFDDFFVFSFTFLVSVDVFGASVLTVSAGGLSLDVVSGVVVLAVTELSAPVAVVEAGFIAASPVGVVGVGSATGAGVSSTVISSTFAGLAGAL